MNLLAITCCFNRKERTLASLEQMKNFVKEAGFNCHFLVVDDCSSDKTFEAIKTSYPDVEIIQTSGNAYWAGAMRFGWEHIQARADEFEAVLAFNDDINLDLRRLKLNTPIIEKSCYQGDLFIGQFCDSKNQISYGLNIGQCFWHPLRFNLKYEDYSIDYLVTRRVANFNFVVIPTGVIKRIGFFKPYFVHKGADFEFSLRALNAGIKLIGSNGFIGVCERNNAAGSSKENGISFKERWRRLTSNKEEKFSMRYKYYYEYAGFFWPLLLIAPYVTLPFKHLKLKCS